MNTQKLTALITALLLPIFAHTANSPSSWPAGEGRTQRSREGEAIRLADAGPAKVNLDIPAGELADALKALATQTGTDLVYRPEQVKGFRTKGLKGELTARDAVNELLKGTSLRASINATTGAMLITEPRPIASRGEAVAVNLAQADQAMQKVEGEANKNSSSGTDENKFPSSAGTSAEEDESKKGVPEILVKGSKGKFSLNADVERTPDDIQPYVVLDRDVIQRSAAANVEDLLRARLTMNYVSQASEQARPVLGTGSTSAVALRGLSADQTLILIDGRRPGIRGVSGSALQPDLNAIPLSAIERIEILPAAASGIYGGNATGGVVNIVLRRDYSGLEARVDYESSLAGGGDQRRIGLNGGTSFDHGATSLMFNASFSERDPLRVRQRKFVSEYARRKDSNRRANDASYLTGGTPPPGAAVNVSSASQLNIPCVLQALAGGSSFDAAIGACSQAPNLTLKTGQALGSPIASVPLGYTGTATDGGAAFLATAGHYNVDPADSKQAGARGASLLNDPTIYAFSLAGTHTFSSRLDGYFSLDGSRNDARFSQNSIVSTFDIPASAPNNPFDQSIRVNVPVRIDNGNDSFSRTDAVRALLGVKLHISDSWNSSIEYSFDRTDLDQSLSTASVSSAAAGAVASGAIDVLKTPPAGGFDLSEFVIKGLDAPPSHTTQSVFSTRIAGPLATLPAGPLAFTALLEYSKQSYSEFAQVGYDESGTPSPYRYSEQSSAVKSAYIETNIPLVAETSRIPGVMLAEMQVAARGGLYDSIGGMQITDSYNSSMRPRSHFSSFDPTIGLRIRPVSFLTLRGSYSTGFYPPRLTLLNPAPPQIITFLPLLDPKRGNEVIGSYTVYAGGNPNLKPETSRSRSIGAVVTPFVESLRFSFDWTRISKRDNFSAVMVNQQTINQEDQLPGAVLRSTDPATFGIFGVGPVLGLDATARNATRAYTDSYDLSLSYSYRSKDGIAVDLDTKATRLLHNQEQLFPLQPLVDRAGYFTTPEWQANAALTLSWRSISATWLSRYLDEMWVNIDHTFSAAQGADRLGSAVYHDLSLQYRFDNRQPMSGVPGGYIQAGLKNVFNRKPRFSALSGTGYDTWSSPMMATYYLSLGIKF